MCNESLVSVVRQTACLHARMHDHRKTLTCMSMEYDSTEYEYGADCESAEHGAIRRLSFMVAPPTGSMKAAEDRTFVIKNIKYK